jgi:hypothetical protein
VQVVDIDAENAGIRDCVREVLRGLRFPRHQLSSGQLPFSIKYREEGPVP